MSWAPAKTEYGPLECAAMRLLFAVVVARHVPASLAHLQITLPNGLAGMFDLEFLLDPEVFAVGRYLLWAALILYVLRIGWSIALPYMTAFSIAVGSVNNSHGAISHYLQIVSLVLCAQTAAHFYSLARRNRDAGHGAAAQREQRVIYWSQQAIVATYLVAALTKLIRTSGMWFLQSPLIALQIIKTNDQDRYDNLGVGSYESASAIADWIVQHPLITGLVLSTGLLLELIAPIALFGRAFAAGYGVSLLLFHATVHRVMKLHFVYNEYLIWIYLVNVPFWILLACRAIQRRRAAPSAD